MNIYTYDIVTSVTSHMFVAESPEAFSYDVDGNLLSDGRFAYAWDADPPSPRLWRTLNPVVAMQTLSGLPTNLPVVRVEFEYDYMSRRVGKTVYEWNTSSNDWQEVSVSVFLYDGWNVTRSVTLSNDGAQTNFFIWGLDLSGSLQGAGGVGGLLSAVFGGTSTTSSVCYTYDGNGNVSELVDSGTGAILAHYEYSPFGETIVATGDLAKDNPFRFSTKYTDDETSLLYYGYRYYSPGLGRFISRDPLEEHAGVNLYIAAIINSIEYLGLSGMQPWGDVEPSLVDMVDPCYGEYGGYESRQNARFWCNENIGVAQGRVVTVSYWHVDNLPEPFRSGVAGGELAHYNAAKRLHATLETLVNSHNGTTYSDFFHCNSWAEELEVTADNVIDDYLFHQLFELEPVHRRYGRRILQHFNCNNVL